MKRVHPYLPLLPLGALLLATMGVGPCDSQPLGSVDGGRDAGSTTDVAKDGSPASLCTYAGKTYALAETFADSDGCNKCTCQAGGQVACTLLACLDAATDVSVVCSYNGVTRKEGETFSSTDGCNTCSCSAGSVACTKKACPTDAGAIDGGGTCLYQGVTHAPKDTFPSSDGCNTCTCTSGGLVACTVQSCPTPDASRRMPCTYGADQTCNEDPLISTVRGTCLPDGTCKCGGGVSPYTGRCLDPGDTTGEGCELGTTILSVGTTTPCLDGCGTCACMAPGTLAPVPGSCENCTDVLLTSGTCALQGAWRTQAIAGCAAVGKYLTKLVLNPCADASQFDSGSYKCCDKPPSCGNSSCKPGFEYCALVNVARADKIATCRPYPTGCSTCACALADAMSTLQQVPNCTGNAVTCTDGASSLQSTDTSDTLIVSCTVP